MLLVLGIPLDEPVWTSGDDPVDLGPQAVAAVSDVWHRGRTYDLVLCCDRLLLVLAAGRGPDVAASASPSPPTSRTPIMYIMSIHSWERPLRLAPTLGHALRDCSALPHCFSSRTHRSSTDDGSLGTGIRTPVGA